MLLMYAQVYDKRCFLATIKEIFGAETKCWVPISICFIELSFRDSSSQDPLLRDRRLKRVVASSCICLR